MICDGTDPIASYVTVREAVDRARSGGGATLVEAKCYRAMSHTTDDNQLTYRTPEEIEASKKRDPVPRFEAWLADRGYLDERAATDLKARALAEVNEATDWAEMQPLPTPEDLYTHVYAEGPLS